MKYVLEGGGRASGSRSSALNQVPAFSPVLRKLLALVSASECSLLDVVRLIQADTVLAAEVLRLANSAIFAPRFEVISILHATSTLGLDRLKALVITVGFRDLLAGVRHRWLLDDCWRHNFASALGAEALAPVWRVDPSVAYTASLLHDLGAIALLISKGAEYTTLRQRSKTEGVDLTALEIDAFGLDHDEAGRLVAKQWCLPPTLCRLVAPSETNFSESESLLRMVVSISCELAADIGFRFAPTDPKPETGWLEQSLPAPFPPGLSDKVAQLRETLPYHVHLFEKEFLF